MVVRKEPVSLKYVSNLSILVHKAVIYLSIWCKKRFNQVLYLRQHNTRAPNVKKCQKAKTVGQCNKLYVMNLRNILAEWYLIKLFSFISRDLLEGHRQSLYGWKTKTNL